jgi:uncharacterized membrane protein
MTGSRKPGISLLISGFLIVLPVLLAGLLLERIFYAVRAVIHPLLDALPGTVFQDPAVRFAVVCVTLAGLLMLVGVLARTRIGQASGRWLETNCLNRLPFYSLLRNLASGLAGKENENSLKPVLVTVNPGMQQMGLLVERLPDGSGAVFIPSSPNPGSGAVFVVEASLIRELNVPAHRTVQCLARWGDGTAKVLKMSDEATADKNRTAQ